MNPDEVTSWPGRVRCRARPEITPRSMAMGSSPATGSPVSLVPRTWRAARPLPASTRSLLNRYSKVPPVRPERPPTIGSSSPGNWSARSWWIERPARSRSSETGTPGPFCAVSTEISPWIEPPA